MEESYMNGIEFYYAGKMLVTRCDSLVEIPDDAYVSSARLVGDIRRGILIDTECAHVEPILYTHDGLLDKGYTFGCTGDLADTKLMKLAAASMYGTQCAREER